MREKVFPGQANTGFFQVKNECQGQFGMLESFQPPVLCLEQTQPWATGRSMVVDLGDGACLAGYFLQYGAAK